MTFPASTDVLPLCIMPADGFKTESYQIKSTTTPPYSHQIGSGLTPPPTSDIRHIPKGGLPLTPPGAPTAGAVVTGAGNFLNAGTYEWVMTYVTPYGETAVSNWLSLVVAAALTAQTIVFPALPSQTPSDPPITGFRLYRTAVNGSPATLSNFGMVYQSSDLSETQFIDYIPDGRRGVAPPSSNASGVNPSPVSVNDGGVTTWVEQSTASALASAGQYSVDYSITQNGGLIQHSAADAGKTVTIFYTAATYANSALVNKIITALKDDRAIMGGGPQGPASDLTTRLSGYDTIPGDVNGLYGTFPNINTSHQPQLVGSITTTTPPDTQMDYWPEANALIVPVSGVASQQSAGHNSGFDVINVSSRRLPTLLGHVDAPLQSGTTNQNPVACVVVGSYLYVMSGVFGHIWTYLLDNLTAPQLFQDGQTGGPGSGGGLLKVGRNVFAGMAGGSTPQVFAIDPFDAAETSVNSPFTGTAAFIGASNTAHPRLASMPDQRFVLATVNGSASPGSNTIAVFSATNDTFLELSSYTNATYVNNPTALAVYGQTLYAFNGSTMGVVGIGNMPGGMVGVNTFNDGNIVNVVHATVAGRYLICANGSANNVLIYDVGGSPAFPTLLTKITGLSNPVGVKVVGSHLFIANRGTGQVLIYDLTGLQIMAARIGALSAGSIDAEGYVTIGRGLDTPSAIIGGGGLHLEGLLSAVGGMKIGGHLRTSESPLGISPTISAGVGVTSQAGNPTITGSDISGNIGFNANAGTHFVCPAGGELCKVYFAGVLPTGAYPNVQLEVIGGGGFPTSGQQALVNCGLFVRNWDGGYNGSTYTQNFGFSIMTANGINATNPCAVTYHVEW